MSSVEGYPQIIPVLSNASGRTLLSEEEFCLEAGQKLFLSTPPDFKIAKASWGSGSETNVGVTTRIQVFKDDVSVLEAHSGENYTPTSTILWPVVRTLLEADETGIYVVRLYGSAYSDGAAEGMNARVYGHTGLVWRWAPGSQTWGRTAANTILKTGVLHSPLTYTLSDVGDCNITFFCDVETTTCNYASAYGGICSARPAGASGSVVQSWIEVQGKDGSGDPVGSLYSSPVIQKTVTSSQHHGMFNHELSTYLPSSAETASFALRCKVISGDYMVVHQGYGYTHAVALR